MRGVVARTKPPRHLWRQTKPPHWPTGICETKPPRGQGAKRRHRVARAPNEGTVMPKGGMPNEATEWPAAPNEPAGVRGTPQVLGRAWVERPREAATALHQCRS